MKLGVIGHGIYFNENDEDASHCPQLSEPVKESLCQEVIILIVSAAPDSPTNARKQTTGNNFTAMSLANKYYYFQLCRWSGKQLQV